MKCEFRSLKLSSIVILLKLLMLWAEAIILNIAACITFGTFIGKIIHRLMPD